MKIAYFGGGYVGACSAAVSADSGHEVLVYDINSELVRRMNSGDKEEIESYLFERGLGEMVVRNQARLRFSDQLADVEKFADTAEAIFMCLPTPEKGESGETDLGYYEKAAENLGRVLAKRNEGKQSQYVLLINKSTVPIEMAKRTGEIMDSLGVKNYGLGSNPEFLVEGKAIEGSIRPSRIVVGAWSEKDFIIFRQVYNRFYQAPNIDYIEVNPFEAAAGKLLANYILFNRLATCFDVVGRTCEKFSSLQFEAVRKILISDPRIGEWGFYDSLFAGGSCFIKDARSLAFQLAGKGAETEMVTSVLRANERQLKSFLNRAEAELNFDWTGKKIALLGLAFKRDTNDLRNSAAVPVTEFLLAKGVAEVRAYDPAAGENYQRCLAGHQDKAKISLVDSEEAALAGAEAVIIATDWPQFREVDALIGKHLPAGALVLDGRRMLAAKYDKLAKAGYRVIAVGAGTI